MTTLRQRVGTLTRMTRTDWQWLALAWVALARARWRIARQPMPATIADLQRGARPPHTAINPAPVVQAVLRAKHLFPIPMLCLPESLAVAELLAERGQPCDLVLGARLTEAGLDAHAWVEQAGIPLNSPPESAETHPVYLRETIAYQGA
jgi:hypothetical protein